MKRNLLGKISSIFGAILLGLFIVAAILLVPIFNSDSKTYARILENAEGPNQNCNPGKKVFCSGRLKCRVALYRYTNDNQLLTGYNCRRSPTFDAPCLQATRYYYVYYNNSSNVNKWGKCVKKPASYWSSSEKEKSWGKGSQS